MPGAPILPPVGQYHTDPAVDHERIFLEGPRSRLQELVFSFKVLLEFIRGFRVFHFMGPCVSVFGSARIREGTDYYELARQMGAGLSRLGFGVITGGGPGLMEAANRGAREAGGLSAGCNIVLPKEQMPNRYIDRQFTSRYFFVRKVLMFKYSSAFVIKPGGIGTMDEFFEALTLVQTGKILDFPIVIFGKEYEAQLLPLFHSMLEDQTISPEDLKYVLFTDSIDEALEHINTVAMQKYREQKRKTFHRSLVLGE